MYALNPCHIVYALSSFLHYLCFKFFHIMYALNSFHIVHALNFFHIVYV